MKKNDAAIIKRREAKRLFDQARKLEEKTGTPDGASYKKAAEAYAGAMLLEQLYQRENGRRNTGSGGTSTKDKIQFLRNIVRQDEERDSLTDEVLANVVKSEHRTDAKKFWPGKTDDDLEKAIVNFIRQDKCRREQIYNFL